MNTHKATHHKRGKESCLQEHGPVRAYLTSSLQKNEIGNRATDILKQIKLDPIHTTDAKQSHIFVQCYNQITFASIKSNHASTPISLVAQYATVSNVIPYSTVDLFSLCYSRQSSLCFILSVCASNSVDKWRLSSTGCSRLLLKLTETQ